MVRYTHHCNRGMNAMGTTNHFLIELSPTQQKGTHTWNCKLDQEPMTRDALGPRKKLLLLLLLFCVMGIVSKCLLNKYFIYILID